MCIGEGQVLHMQQHFALGVEKVATHRDPTDSLSLGGKIKVRMRFIGGRRRFCAKSGEVKLVAEEIES